MFQKNEKEVSQYVKFNSVRKANSATGEHFSYINNEMDINIIIAFRREIILSIFGYLRSSRVLFPFKRIAIKV